MKYLQTFSVFESQTSATLTPDQESFLNRYTKGTWSVNPATGLVDVQGSFACSKWRLKSLYGIRFGMVAGDFYCAGNQLTILEGAPRTVEGNFYCENNQLISLTGAPQTVKGDFWCERNLLTTLEGAPQTVEGDFYCYSNKLTTLEGAPETVRGDFSCSINQLTSLAGAPQTVEGGFYCDAFPLEPGKWNLAGWEQVLHTGSLEARKLIQTLPYLQPDWWNSELSKDPARTIQKLAPVWSQMSDDLKRGIRIPPGYEDRFGMRSEFSDLGLF
jgi:hypothetical protein